MDIIYWCLSMIGNISLLMFIIYIYKYHSTIFVNILIRFVIFRIIIIFFKKKLNFYSILIKKKKTRRRSNGNLN